MPPRGRYVQLRRDEPPWHVLEALEPRAAQLLRGLFVAPALPQDGADGGGLRDGAPSVMGGTRDGDICARIP